MHLGQNSAARYVAADHQRKAGAAYSNDLLAAWKTIDKATENIAITHHKSLRRVQSSLHMGKGAFTHQGTNKTSVWNAYMWKKLKEQRESEGLLMQPSIISNDV